MELVCQENKGSDSKVSDWLWLAMGGASKWLNFVTASVSLSVQLSCCGETDLR